MLQFKVIHYPQQKQEIFEQFSPENGTWLVSDLKSKAEIQKRFLSQGNLLAENSVLRASELWRKFFVKHFPGHRLVSADLMKSFVAQWLEDSHFTWARSPGTAKNLMIYGGQLLPILIHPQSQEAMKDWWDQHPDSLLRWGHWYHLSQWLWEKLDEARIVPSQWVASWLISQERVLSLSWSRQLLVDLGSELSAVEAEVIWQLSQSSPVTVLVPGPSWREKFVQSLRGYRVLEEKNGSLIAKSKLKSSRSSSLESHFALHSEEDLSSHLHAISNTHLTDQKMNTPLNSGPDRLAKYSSMLAEVKAAVNQVRWWIESGISPSQIIVMAPDIEKYWPVMSAYFASEGIPVAKERVSTLQSYPEILAWLAQMRVELGMGQATDLELSRFTVDQSSPISFEEFKKLFTHYYDWDDLRREKRIAELFHLDVQEANDSINCEEFVAWAVRRWKASQQTSHLELIIQKIFQEAPLSQRMNRSHWFFLLENFCARIEVRLSEAQIPGVALLNLISGEWVNASHLWVMGLSEEGMRKSESAGILLNDVLSLEKDLGVFLSYPDRMTADFELEWVLKRHWQEVFLSTPMTHFSGAVQTPSLLWLKRAVDAGFAWEHCLVPDPTRWDQLQSLKTEALVRELPQTKKEQDLCLAHLEVEWGTKELPTWLPSNHFSLSVSQIEAYLECPFKVAATRLLKLSDTPNIDLDVDSLGRGNLLHQLFELLIQSQSWKSEISAEEILIMIDQAKEMSGLILADERLWTPLKNKFLQVAQRFIQFEREWRQQYPQTKTLACELQVQGRFDPQANQFLSSNYGEGGILFRGKIDRVDGIGGEEGGPLIVIDYKSSGGNLRHHRSWMANQQLQLALYSHWLELGWGNMSEGNPQGHKVGDRENRERENYPEVIAAVYFVARDMDRSKGFILSGGEEGLISDSSSHSRIQKNEKAELFHHACQLTGEVVQSMMAGQFGPRPKDIHQTCSRCEWKKICRAPHFN